MSGKSDAKKLTWYANRCSKFLDEVAGLKRRITELEALLGKDESACTMPGDVCDYDGGCDTCPHRRGS